MDQATALSSEPERSLASRLPEAALVPEDLWLGKPIPRYTSYPPASLFEPTDSAAYVQALAALPEAEPLSLYLHIPFCKTVCLYCGCNTCATQNELRVQAYLETMLQEAKMTAQLMGRKRRIARVHMGGGSPNILTERQIDALFWGLSAQFDLAAADEIAVELDPRQVTYGQAALLAACGVTRVSLGVQDFAADVQAAIGRIQPFIVVERTVEILRDAGIRHISLDLMYGLPRQTPASIAQSARLALALAPDRISLFSYAHVPQLKKQQRALETYGLPDPYLCLTLESAVRMVLREGGLTEIGMDHFARPDDPLVAALQTGRLRRTFQGYTNDPAENLLALGASSIGRIGATYVQNERDSAAYAAKIAQGRFATVRGLRLTGEDKLRAAVIERLMCDLSCNIEVVCRAHNFSPATLAADLEALAPFVQAGLVKRTGWKIELTSPHRMAIRAVAQIFDTATRHKMPTASRVA
jgi:oxygen-independent coproporphyrinogen-3 oxidase